MSRVILVLFIAAVVFVLVWFFAPDLIQQYLPQAAAPTAHPEESAKAAIPPAATKPAARKRPASISAGSTKTSEISTAAVAPVTTLRELPQPTVPTSVTGRPVKPLFSVTTETATLYSTNASAGPVVSYLRKGEVVEPQFILNSAGQEWMFVSVSDRRLTGFLRVENLAKKQADQTSR